MGRWANKRSKPYTVEGIKRMRCIRCDAPASFQWNICADGPYRPVCILCDIEVNRLVLEYMGHPDAAKLIAKYTREKLGES